MRYRFREFELDTERFELARSGEKVELRPKVFDALRYLLEHAGRLVTKQELLDALWESKTVEEAAVPWTISYVRRAIGQGAGDKGPLETVHGRGYRWSEPVAIEGEQTVAPLERVTRPFVGRESLLAALRQRLHEAQTGRGSACMLIGDAGIGKTRCIDELAAFARAQGCPVWIGRCAPDTIAPVYSPWIQLLGSADGHGSGPKRQLRSLIARLSARTSEAGVDGRDAVLGQLSLFEAVSRWLNETSRPTPVVLVLEDLHWADQGTLELLGFVAAELTKSRALLLTASRNVLAGRAAELVRDVERFDLGPLSVDEVATYVRTQTEGTPPAPELCEALHRVSAGYPLFLQGTVHGLLAQHGPVGLAALPAERVQPSPHTRDSLSSRLSTFAPDTRHALECASVFGDRFDAGSLLRLIDLPHDTLMPALDDGVHRGFLCSQGVHRFAFRHALFREAVYEAISGAKRAHLHRQVALMRAAAPDAAEHTSEIALHHYRSLTLGHHAEVRRAAVAAAELASRAFAFADAAQFYAFALEAIALDPQATRREYAELLLARAQAQRYGGSAGDGRRTLEQLCAVATEHGFGDILVHAARTMRMSYALGGLPDPLARDALERALVLLPESARELRLQALSLLAWLSPTAHDISRSKVVSAQLVEQARGYGSRETLAEALIARLYLLSGPDDIDALLSASEEILALDGPSRGGLSVEAHSARYGALLLRGDLAAAETALSSMRAIAGERALVQMRWQCERLAAERQIARGEFAAARAEFARLERDVPRLRISGGAEIVRANRAWLGRLTLGKAPPGVTGEPTNSVASPARQLLETYPSFRVGRARLALAHGRPDIARRTLAELTTDGCSNVPKDLTYLHTLCALAQLAVGLRDRSSAAGLLELLAPYAHYTTPSFMRAYDRPVAHCLARVAAFLGLEPAADRYFAQALEIEERLELKPLLAIDHFAFARWLSSSGRAAQASALRTEAHNLAASLGMGWLAQEARELNAP